MTQPSALRIHAIITGWLLPILCVLAACAGSAPPAADHLLDQSRQVWSGDWHAVWQIEWAGAPVRGELVAEIWHTGDGRLRVETLEAPAAALSGLTLVDDGHQVWLHDVRLNQVHQGARGRVRIPLADDMLAAMDWLLSEASGAAVAAVRGDELESGPATRLELTTTGGAQATLWVNDESGLPAGLAFSRNPWGEVNCVTRSIQHPAHLVPGLFTFRPPPDAEIIAPDSLSPRR
jgi:outer membrane lipoprotein-sorting protein